MSTWPTRQLTGAERAEMLAPFGVAWRKVLDAFDRKLETMTDDELEHVIDACRDGRWHHDLAGDSYASSFEVERQALAMRNRRNAARKV